MKILVLIIFLSLAVLINSQCLLCNTVSLIGCLSSTQFVPCDVNGVFNFGAIGTCATGTFCNSLLGAGITCGATSVCQNPIIPILTTTTTTTTTTTSTTTAKPTNAVTFCAAKAMGRYADPADTTCTNYVYCFPNGTAMVGGSYSCMGTTKFNPTTQFCDAAFACAG